MFARLHSVALYGIEAIPCEVEVDVAERGFSGTTIVGLPDTAVKESIERVHTALLNCGYQLPRHRSTINLAPGDVKKEGPAFDLAIALGLMLAGGLISCESCEDCLVAGELALDGRIRPIKGALSMAMLAAKQGRRGLMVPYENANEAAVVADIDVIPVANLAEAVGYMTGRLELEPTRVDLDRVFAEQGVYDVDFADVRGQEQAKRALTIAAAGGHNVLMIGPPGSGKTMLCKRLPTILPPLTRAESLETTQIYSSAGMLSPGQSLMARRPVRSPHHSASGPALVGGGSVPQAGEVSLSHHGVLFLDELPEFPRSILESLRQPLEDGVVNISRAYGSVSFPAKFMLVAAMNPCPCGYFGDSRKPCKCSPPQIDKYVARISGPMIDRIDIHIEVPAVPYQELRSSRDGTSSEDMREQVVRARETQRVRYGDGSTLLNARLAGRRLKQWCQLDEAGESTLRQAISELGLSARAHDKVLRVARTIADLDGKDRISAEHLAEAIQYRRLDRRL